MLNHPSIVRGYVFGHEEDFFYLIMEFVEGQDLSRRIKEKGRLPEKESLGIAFIQIAQGTPPCSFSIGIIHPGWKPANISAYG